MDILKRELARFQRSMEREDEQVKKVFSTIFRKKICGH